MIKKTYVVIEKTDFRKKIEIEGKAHWDKEDWDYEIERILSKHPRHSRALRADLEDGWVDYSEGLENWGTVYLSPKEYRDKHVENESEKKWWTDQFAIDETPESNQ